MPIMKIRVARDTQTRSADVRNLHAMDRMLATPGKEMVEGDPHGHLILLTGWEFNVLDGETRLVPSDTGYFRIKASPTTYRKVRFLNGTHPPMIAAFDSGTTLAIFGGVEVLARVVGEVTIYTQGDQDADLTHFYLKNSTGNTLKIRWFVLGTAVELTAG